MATANALKQFSSKPNYGQAGRPIMIVSNHYSVSFDINKALYSYYVNINKVGFKNINNNIYKNESLFRSVIKRLIDVNCQPGSIFHNIISIYDGASCMFTTERLPIIDNKVIKFRVTLNDNEVNLQEFEVCLKMVKIVSFNSIEDFYQNSINDGHIEAIRSINLVIRYLFSNTRFLVGRSSFHLNNENDNRNSISALKELSYGIFSSIKPCLSGLQLILDRSCTPFMKSLTIDECIITFLKEFGNQQWNEGNKRRLENIIKDFMFEVTNLQRSRRYKIFGLTLESANQVTFQSDGQAISVAEYFQKTYFPLRRPDLPCVKVRRPRQDFIYFPVEVCKIVADQKTKKLTIKEKSDLIRSVAGVNPTERFKVIQDSVRELIKSDEDCKYFREFGITIVPEPIIIKGRVLEVPQLLEGDNKAVNLVDGKWRINKFYKPINLNRWILVSMFQFDNAVIDRFLKTLIHYGKQLGMEIKNPFKIYYEFNVNDISNFFQKMLSLYPNIELFFFLGCDNELQYNTIKKFGDVNFSVATQCMKQANVIRFNQSIATNVLQKINTKLAGINVLLNFDKIPLFSKYDHRNTLVIGIDVAHPSPTERNCPSIAALVGNCDSTFSHYSSSVKIQKLFRQEIIEELDKMLIEILENYENRMKTLPKSIIFYRDGVSEGQFNVVYKEEINVIKKKLNNYRPGYNAKVTFIIVQKRHHTRFLPDDSEKSSNIPPGTVVDNQVCHPSYFDFFLCSHAGIQGTSRPTHYCVLSDENEMTADMVQNLTNVLCHLYARCSRSISIPTPVFYAHLAAFRARAHIQASTNINNLMNYENKVKMGYARDNKNQPNNRIHYANRSVASINDFHSYIQMSPEMRSSMYFC